ncbi:hypothetical protein HJD18_13375 [Thermoleophilia bacterium SCSIO 60948]|nr:hypothetical protein HJD18_13375 [Thermoleophilia bacterium SCSIO 60948]
MGAGRLTRGLGAAVVATLLSLVLALPAEADTLRGKLERGKAALLILDKRGAFERVTFKRWRAPCSGRGTFRETTSFIRPMDSLTDSSFRDQGSYKLRYDNGATARVRVDVKGRRRSAGVWSGTFGAKVTIKDRQGDVFNRCRFREADWTVRR